MFSSTWVLRPAKAASSCVCIRLNSTASSSTIARVNLDRLPAIPASDQAGCLLQSSDRRDDSDGGKIPQGREQAEGNRRQNQHPQHEMPDWRKQLVGRLPHKCMPGPVFQGTVGGATRFRKQRKPNDRSALPSMTVAISGNPARFPCRVT